MDRVVDLLTPGSAMVEIIAHAPENAQAHYLALVLFHGGGTSAVDPGPAAAA